MSFVELLRTAVLRQLQQGRKAWEDHRNSDRRAHTSSRVLGTTLIRRTVMQNLYAHVARDESCRPGRRRQVEMLSRLILVLVLVLASRAAIAALLVVLVLVALLALVLDGGLLGVEAKLAPPVVDALRK